MWEIMSSWCWCSPCRSGNTGWRGLHSHSWSGQTTTTWPIFRAQDASTRVRHAGCSSWVGSTSWTLTSPVPKILSQMLCLVSSPQTCPNQNLAQSSLLPASQGPQSSSWRKGYARRCIHILSWRSNAKYPVCRRLCPLQYPAVGLLVPAGLP